MSFRNLFRSGPSARFAIALVSMFLILGPGLHSAQPTSAAPGPRTFATAPAVDESEPGVCKGCAPPLAYNGGPVMGTSTVTVTPIYWLPAGFSFPTGYVDLVNRYLTDVAAASGATDNTYAILGEYSQNINGTQTNIKYQLAAGAPITDTNPYPAADPSCTLEAPYQTCTTQAQIETELGSVLQSNNLPADINHLYAVFFPPNTQQLFGTDRSVDQFCGIHSSFSAAGGPVVYADEPYITDGCSSGQSPNNNVGADTQVDTLSHEIAESISDPGVSGSTAWIDSTGNEIGDECSYNYGPALGSTDPNNPSTTEYNQVINGDKYYTQTMFSNASYSAKGQGNGCLQSVFNPGTFRAHARAGQTTDMPSTATLDATDTSLSADGQATSAITISVLDDNGEPVSGDHIHFDVKSTAGTIGVCGTLSASNGITDVNGEVTVTYTASKDNVACLILGIDADSGSSDAAIIYQGTAQDLEPGITDATVPDSLTPGGPAETFTVTANNPGTTDILDARFDAFLTGDDNGAGGLGVKASQVQLSYADDSTGGAFVNIPLDGETANDGEIDAYVMPDKTADLPAGASRTVTFRISLDASAPTSATTGSSLKIEVDLDQFDPADSSQYNLDYVGPSDVPVTAAGQNPPTATPTSTATPTATATATSTPTATATATPIPLFVRMKLAHKSIAAGAKQKVSGTTVPGASVHIQVAFPDKKKLNHSGTADDGGTYSWTFKQPAGRTTAGNHTAKVTVTVSDGSETMSTSKKYTIS